MAGFVGVSLETRGILLLTVARPTAGRPPPGSSVASAGTARISSAANDRHRDRRRRAAVREPPADPGHSACSCVLAVRFWWALDSRRLGLLHRRSSSVPVSPSDSRRHPRGWWPRSATVVTRLHRSGSHTSPTRALHGDAATSDITKRNCPVLAPARSSRIDVRRPWAAFLGRTAYRPCAHRRRPARASTELPARTKLGCARPWSPSAARVEAAGGLESICAARAWASPSRAGPSTAPGGGNRLRRLWGRSSIGLTIPAIAIRRSGEIPSLDGLRR